MTFVQQCISSARIKGLQDADCQHEALEIYATHMNTQSCLTRLPLDKMAAISPDNIFKCIFSNEKFRFLTEISLEFVSKGPIDNNPALVKIMAWHLFGAKPLSEPMLIPPTDSYMWH